MIWDVTVRLVLWENDVGAAHEMKHYRLAGVGVQSFYGVKFL
jgi:hypothetical protein